MKKRIGTILIPLLVSSTASAQTLAPVSCVAPLDADFLKARTTRGIITRETVSETGMTVPSLWWAKKQLDPSEGELIVNWIAYQDERRIDAIVDRQLWSLLNYVERYRLINNLGTAAREYQYNLRVFNQQQQCLATYACNYRTTPPQCEVTFDPSARSSLQFNNQTQTE